MAANLIQGYPTLKAGHAEQRYGKVLEEEVDRTARVQFGMSSTKVGINMLIGLMAYLGEIALVVVSIYLIAVGRLTVGAWLGPYRSPRCWPSRPTTSPMRSTT